MIEQKYKVMRVRVLAFGLKSRIMFVGPTVGPTRGGYFNKISVYHASPHALDPHAGGF